MKWPRMTTVITAVSACVAAPSHPAETTSVPQGRTWESLGKLPDWSGVWTLSDQSFSEVLQLVGANGGTRIPLRPDYEALRAANVDLLISNETRCIPVGMPESMQIPIGHEYLFTPGRVTVTFENGTIQRVDTSGRPHPRAETLTPTFAGNSIGHWEGRALVVDTIGLSSQAEFLFGLRVTERTHLMERISQRGHDTLRVDFVIEDPGIFTEPYSFTRIYKRSTVAPMMDYYTCVDGARDKMADGAQIGVDVTPPAGSEP